MDLARIRVRERYLRRTRCTRLQELDRAPVGKIGNRQTGNRCKRPPIVERRGHERLPCLRQKLAPHPLFIFGSRSRLERGLLRGEVAELRLVLHTCGEVSRDLREPNQRARLWVTERRDRDVGPEARAVFAQTPALVLETPLTRRDLELPFALTRGDVLGWVEDREVFSDDLPGRVALDPLGARVPRRDAPLRVEDENRVVLHAFDEQTKAPRSLLARSPLGLEHLSRAIQFGEHRDLRFEHRGFDGLLHDVNRAARVRTQDALPINVDRGHEDDRSAAPERGRAPSHL